jgi:hypothetical protein
MSVAGYDAWVVPQPACDGSATGTTYGVLVAGGTVGGGIVVLRSAVSDTEADPEIAPVSGAGVRDDPPSGGAGDDEAAGVAAGVAIGGGVAVGGAAGGTTADTSVALGAPASTVVDSGGAVASGSSLLIRWAEPPHAASRIAADTIKPDNPDRLDGHAARTLRPDGDGSGRDTPTE